MTRARTSSLAFGSALAQASADKRLEILRHVQSSGSISQAAREAGVSYKAAWQAIDTLTNLAGVALVERVVGGAGGGGARLTAAGRQLLVAAGALAEARAQVLQRLGTAPATQGAGQLAVRTSMRNQLRCTVSALEGRGPAMLARLTLADGTPLQARITRESAQLLGLAPGQGALVLCKATAVVVWRQPPGAAELRANQLVGRAKRVSRGDLGDEVVADVDAGVQLVGYAAANSGLRAGSRVLLSVDAAALVLASA